MTEKPLIHRIVGEQIVANDAFDPSNVVSIAETFVDAIQNELMSDDEGPIWLVRADGQPFNDFAEPEDAATELNAGGTEAVGVIDLRDYRRRMLAYAKEGLPTATVQALVSLEVTPGPGQSISEAVERIQAHLAEYLTSPEYHFREDYGIDREQAIAVRAGRVDVGDLGLHGYDGPFVLGATVQAIAPPTTAP